MVALRSSALERYDTVFVARMFADVSGPHVEGLRRRIDDEVGSSASLVLDLRAATHIDSDGVRVLFDLAMWLFSTGRSLRLVVSDATIVRRVLILTKLDQAVPIDPTLEAALASLHQSGMDNS